jgi:hypothetical protein
MCIARDRSDAKSVVSPLKYVAFLIVFLSAISAYSQNDNGIHVGEAKVFDDRELTLMLDSLNRSLQGKNFVDPNALANALGNVQGYQNSDTSFGFFANGAVGPQAAAVFAGNLPAGASSSSAPSTGTTSSGPSFTINVNPASTTTTTTASSATPAATVGPQPPTLPTLQTPPTYTPNFGPSSSDLLTDEVNLTYQIYNLSLLLSRSLTDRTFDHQSRLQAVVGFDIDIEPDEEAKNGVAVVDISACMLASGIESGNVSDNCNSGLEKPHIVALMPEEGSHNAATLTQKANAFAGALAAQVYSAGFAFQKRSQVFYLYRDIDTVSFQRTDIGQPGVLHFGWQFRPVLGQPSVEAGLRHMLVVLSLPAADIRSCACDPKLAIHVETHWLGYDGKARTTTTRRSFFSKMPPRLVTLDQTALSVPTTLHYQKDLEPHISNVKWVSTDHANGVAVITGDNFFLGTTIRVGNKTYTGANDGLTLKSDKEVEIALPSTAVASGGLLSGRYGIGRDLEPEGGFPLSDGFSIKTVSPSPQGKDLAMLTMQLVFLPPNVRQPDKAVTCFVPAAGNPYLVFAKTGTKVPVDLAGNPSDLSSVASASIRDTEYSLNYPVVSIDGKQDALETTLDLSLSAYWKCDGAFPPGSLVGQVNATVPAKDLASNSQFISVVFPFAGRRWAQSMPFFTPTLKIDRLGSETRPKLMISSTSLGDNLCDGWKVQMNGCEIPLTPDEKAPASCPAWVEKQNQDKKKKEPTQPPPTLRCVPFEDTRKVSLDISADELKNFKQLLLVHRDGAGKMIDSRSGDVPDAKPKAAAPALADGQKLLIAQYSSRTITLAGKHLDKVTSVLFDKTSLKIVTQADEKIVIDIARSVTAKPGNDQILLMSDGNDPIVVDLTITPVALPNAKGK